MSIVDLEQRIRDLERQIVELQRQDVPQWHFETLINLTDWFAASKTSADNGVIDLSADFGVPALARAVIARVDFHDNTITAIKLGDESGGSDFLGYTGFGNSYDEWVSYTTIIPCDANGDIWLTIDAGPTIEMSLYILSYYI